MSEERRRHRRYEVEGVSGTLAGRERHPFEVLTLSRGGLLVTTGFEPPLGQVLDLEIPLGRDLYRSPGRVVFIGEDKYAARDRRYRVGIALESATAEDGALLDRYIREELEPRSALAEHAGEP
jgi:hypothetical protein